MKQSQLLIIVSFLFSISLPGQNSETETYIQLKQLYKKSQNDSLKQLYAKKYLAKAKRDNDPVRIADGYKFLTLLFYPDPLSVKYADSIINITKGVEDKTYPATGYLLKGAIFYELGNYKKALDEYLAGVRYAKKNNSRLYLAFKFNIGLLKNTIGERNEAQEIFKEYLKFAENNDKLTENYITGLYALADSYVYSKKLDFADGYISMGIHYSLVKGYTSYYSSFVFISGLSSYFRENYSQAIDSLEKANTFFIKDANKATRSALSNYYTGKSLLALEQKEKSILYFQKVDSIIKITHNITPELIGAYTYLIENARQHRDKEQQIKYLSSLIKYDSILDINNKYLKSKIKKEYDITGLIEEKEKLMSLHSIVEKQNYWIVSLAVGLTLSLIVLFFYIRRSILNKGGI